jgi:hypothetical protein
MAFISQDTHRFPILPGEEQDNEKDVEFENLLIELRGSVKTLSVQQKRRIHRLEHILFDGTRQLSQWQKARFWLYVAHIYFAEERYRATLEALLLCEKELPHDATVARAEVYSFITMLALKQGHPLQTMLSSAFVFTAAQRMHTPALGQNAEDSPLPPGIAALLG